MQIVKSARPQDRQAGSFFGRGPKGYIRSDARIYEEACEQLMKHEAIDANDIEVKVERGYVTLLGTVETLREKLLSEQLTRQVLGAAGIVNRLAVRRIQGTIEVEQRDIW
jgi:osmotically-inducible protein OsmY